MSLESWLQNNWLHKHQPVKDDIFALLELAKRDLDDARVSKVSLDNRLGIAYNSALASARAALHASGYRVAKGDSNHVRVADSLQYTLGDVDAAESLRRIQKKRNTAHYDRIDAVTEADFKAAFTLAKRLLGEVEAWLKNKHPDLC